MLRPTCQLGRIYPYHPEYLQAWALVALVCGIVLLAEALATPTRYYVRRRRMISPWQVAFALVPLAGSAGALLFANKAQYQYWFFTTQFNAVLGEHPGTGGYFWGCWTQDAVTQIQGLGIVMVIGSATVLLMGALLFAQWAGKGRGPAISPLSVAPQPA